METNLSKTEQAVIKVLVEKATAKDPMIIATIGQEIGTTKGLRQVVHDLRLKGYPICQNGYGYYYARTTVELGNYIEKIERDLREETAELDGLRRSFGAVGIQFNTEPIFTKRLAVRNTDGSASYKEFKIGKDGQPIIPAGTTLL